MFTNEKMENTAPESRIWFRIYFAGDVFFPHYNIDRTLRAIWLVKDHVLSEYKTQNKSVVLFFAILTLYHKAIEEA